MEEKSNINPKTDYRKDQTKGYFDAFISSEALRERTKIEYWRMIGILCRELQKDFLEITEEDILRFQRSMEALIRRGKLSNRTLRLRLYCYSSFSAYLLRTGVIERNVFAYLYKPVVEDAPYTNKIPSTKECDDMLEAAMAAGEDMYLIYCMILRMGLTTTEICNLKTQNVTEFERDLVCYLYTPGGKKEHRYIVVPEDLKEGLMAFKDSVVTEYLFANSRGKQMTVPALDKRARKIMGTAGLGKFSLKDLRNRAIYQMIHDGAEEEEIALYNNLSLQRVHTFKQSPFAESKMLSICPANLSRIKIMG